MTPAPEDHKPKKTKNIQVTVRGVDISVAPERLDDYELLEAFLEADEASGDPKREGQAAAMSMRAMARIIGAEATTALKSAVRGPDGRVPVAEMGEVLGEVMTALSEAGERPNS